MTSALALLSKAEASLARDRFAAALSLLARAERGASDPFLRAEILWRKAETLRRLGRFSPALADYWRAHALYRRCRVPTERLRTLLGASACLRILGRYGPAAAMWRSVARSSWAAKIVDPSPGEVLLERALVERGAGRLPPCRAMLKRCLPLFRRSGDLEALRHAWWALGGAERFSGNFPAALKAFREAERAARRLGDESARAYALCGLAGSHRLVGNGALSYREYRAAHGIFSRLGDPFGMAYGLCGMGNALRVQGDPRPALKLYRKSAKLYQRVGDEGSRAFAVWGRAGALRRLGRAAAADRDCRAALASFRKVGDHRGVVMALLGRARSVAAQWKLPAARALAAQGERAARRAGLAFETELARLERERLEGRPRWNRLARFGIPTAACRAWKDLP